MTEEQTPTSLQTALISLKNTLLSKINNAISTHDSNSSAHSTEMNKKVDKSQGSSNASKNVVTDSNGNITTESKLTNVSDLSNDVGYLTSVGWGQVTSKPFSSVDDSLSTSSTNPVQNAVVTTAINGKANSSHTHNDYLSNLNDYITVYNNTTGVLSVNKKTALRFYISDDTLYVENPVTGMSYVCVNNGEVTDILDSDVSDTVYISGDAQIYATTSTSEEIGEIRSTGDASISNLIENGIELELLGTVTSSTDLIILVGENTKLTDYFYTESETNTLLSGKSDSSHTHGNVTNDGKLGTSSGKPLITTTGGLITTGVFGTSSGEFAEGNHSHSGMLTTSDIYDDLDSTATNKALSAKQGKALADMIGDAILYINQ